MLVVRADFFEYFDNANPVLKGGASATNFSFESMDRSGSLLTLHESTDFESMFWEEEGKRVGRTFKMSFVWPAGDWFSGQSEFKYWIERTNASTAMLDKDLSGVLISLASNGRAKVR
jgi:hypothetical protein